MQAGSEARGVGQLQHADPHRGQRHHRAARHRGRRDHPRGHRRGHRPRPARHHRGPGGQAPAARVGEGIARDDDGRRSPGCAGRDARALHAAGGRPPARRRRAGGLPGRHHREDPARSHEDQGHHRRSAARGRALRGAQAEGAGGDHGDRRRGGVRRLRQGHAQDRDPRRRRRDQGVPDPARQAHRRARGRPGQGGRGAHGRLARTRTTTWPSSATASCSATS